MARLINADALEDVVMRLNVEGWGVTRNDFKRIEAVISEFPTVDAVPVDRGEWVLIKCSKCGTTLDFYRENADRGDANYCPHCGARMDGEEDE